MVVTKDEALEMFADNPFKVKILSTKVPDGSRTTVYRCGDLIDLCRGPHVAHTGKVKAFAAAKHSAAYWLGDAENDSLQRLYGISFPDKKQLKVWQEMMEKVRIKLGSNIYICNIENGQNAANQSTGTETEKSRRVNDEKLNLILGNA
jgi:threonyl-tRNA synthetase